MKQHPIFKQPLSLDDVISKLMQFKIILLKILTDDNDFLQWAITKQLTGAVALHEQLKQHLQDKEAKQQFVTAIENFNNKLPETIEALKKILKDNAQLRKLLIDNQQCLRTILQRWNEKELVFERKHVSSSTSVRAVSYPPIKYDTFFDEDDSKLLEAFRQDNSEVETAEEQKDKFLKVFFNL